MSDLIKNDLNQDQKTYWSTGPGQSWIEKDAILTELMKHVTLGLVARAQVSHADSILDVGCGTGATSVEFSKATGARGRVVGTDISEPFLDRARAHALSSKAHSVSFTLADAQTYDFPQASFDHLVSRFGVMFFSDPVAAFSNLRYALVPGARLTMACWGPAALNPWFKLPRDIAISHLGKVADTDPRAPGPMAFADKSYVMDVLQAAGFARAQGELAQVDLCPPNNVADAAQLATELGPAVRVIQELGGSPDDVQAISTDIKSAFQRFMTTDGMRVPAAVWFYSAVNETA